MNKREFQDVLCVSFCLDERLLSENERLAAACKRCEKQRRKCTVTWKRDWR